MKISALSRHGLHHLVPVLVVAVIGVTGAAPALAQPPAPPTTTPFTTPNTDGCPQKTQPPPPIDDSEVPAPGEPTPRPLAVPEPPVGGDRLGECGVVLPDGAPPLPQDISATAWQLTDVDSGKVLAAKDPHGRYRSASTIKVLLAIIALRELDLDKVVTGTQADADVEGTRIGIGPGGRYSNRLLIQTLVMASGNDAAHALAAQLGGDEATVEKMNELAKQLHALDTRAATPSGLDGPGTSISAYDLSVAFREALTIPEFTQFINTKEVQFPGYPPNPKIPGDEDHPPFPVANDNQLLYTYPGMIGGKTGFTNDARQTFVAAAERDGRRLSITLLKADVLPIRPPQQAQRLLDYGFALPRDASVGELPDENTNPSTSEPAVASPPGKNSDQSRDSDGGDTATGRTIAALIGVLVVIALLLAARRASRRRR